MEVKIRVGAQVDASMRTAFRPLVQSAIDARRQILREFQQVPPQIAAAFRDLARAQGATYRGATGEARAAAREQVRIARDAGREEASISRDLERDRVNATRIANRQMLTEHRAFDREQRRIARETAKQIAQDRVELDRIATRTSHRFTRFVTPNLPIASIAGRAARGIASGLGIDTTFTGAAQRSIALESAATEVTNQARLNGQTVGRGQVVAAVRGVQKKYGVGSEEAVGGLEQYQKLTGDLGGGLGIFEGLAERSVTTGAKLNDLAAAAGNIANNLGDIPNKGQRTLELLDQFTVQGAQGAIEISDLASQMAKLAAVAPMIQGDAGTNMSRLGALAQIARQQGGAASAQQATTSIGSLLNTFDKGARIKAFTAAGINLRDGNNQLRDPISIIKDVLTKTGGDPAKMNAFIMDAQAKRAVRGLAVEYNKAGGGEKGLAAVDALVGRFQKGGVSEETRSANLKAHNESIGAQVQQFQAALDEIAGTLLHDLLPTLREAEPTIVKFVKAIADMASWAAENPWKAVVAALGASLLRAGIESAIRNAIERAIMGGGGGIGGGALGGVAGGAGADVSKRMAFVRGAQNVSGAAALAAMGVGLAADQANQLQKATGSKATLTDLIPGYRNGKFAGTNELLKDVLDVSIMAPIRAFTKEGRANWKRKFGVIGEQTDAVLHMDDRMNSEARQRFAEESAKAKGEKKPDAFSPEQVQTMVGKSGESGEQLKARLASQFQEGQQNRQRDAIQEQIAKNTAALATKTLKVEVTNPEAFGGEGGTSEQPKAPGGNV